MTASAGEAGSTGRAALTAVQFDVSDGLGVIRLNRPETRNAMDDTVAEELYEVAQRCAARRDLRSLLIAGTGPAFTVGGDISVFAKADAAALPGRIRRMTTPYHETLRILSRLDAPVVTAVHGVVAGGGLGLLYVADIVIAAEGTKFATGFTGLGLSGDGGSSWFLPRLVGLRRAAELYFEQRVLDARQAADWGLVSRVVPADVLQDQARSTALRLAEGPTKAYGEIRRLLRDSWAATLSDHLGEETEAMVRTAATVDAGRGIAAFRAKSAPVFEGW